MRIESFCCTQLCGNRGLVSRCILAKWGLKDLLRKSGAARLYLFQDASSQNEDWKFFFQAALLRHRLSFKMHPRKMRIERVMMLAPHNLVMPVSRCILAKWGLKAFPIYFIKSSGVSFKMHPRKMRIERKSWMPEHIAATWFQDASSQNEDWKIYYSRLYIYRCVRFKMHPRKMRIERNNIRATRAKYGGFKMHPRKMRIERLFHYQYLL